ILEVIVQAESSPQPGQLVGGKYRMVRELGRGAMGAVYEAEQLATGKRVAIKWLHPHVLESRSAVERLVREAQASARVRHSNVVDVYDVEREGETLFLVMEYLEGETLATLLERGGVPFHEVLAMIVQAMRGVAEAHRQGIVHRDIKPDNIFLAHQNDQAEPIAKVLDFGISKLDQPGGLSLTQTGSALGTPLYMSYEQLSGSRDVDARSDIYAFGVILYESLTGMLPYSAENFAELAAKVITSEPPSPRSLRPDIPERLEQIVIWAMKKRREDRPPNLGVLIEALLPYTVAPQGRVSLSARASTSSMPPASLPPTSAASPSMPAPPKLRLDGEFGGDWGDVLDRNQRSRREMEDRVTALIAGTMPDHEQRKPAARRGLWMGVGALTTLVGGIAIASFLLGDKPEPVSRQAVPVVAAPAVEGAAQPTPDQAAQDAKTGAEAQQKAAEPPAPSVPELLRAAPTQVEQVQIEPAQPAKESGVNAGAKNAAVPHHVPGAQARPPVVRGSSVWRPSGDPAAASEAHVAPAPVVPESVITPAPAPEAPPPAAEPKPADLEVPGTAPNPFVDSDEKDDLTKYRAGRPKEDEF
ncbi:MAG: serine/threonine protein kinase, partial [Myxococcaceae bacterium]|nr:serine/threonine protein kinase [Myxococcaceae bacterium]